MLTYFQVKSSNNLINLLTKLSKLYKKLNNLYIRKYLCIDYANLYTF
jgi:hypothetical protein